MDIRCVVCGEPWDAYGVTHGDMLAWQAKLFRAGAGCPSCEGVSNGYEPTELTDVENGDEDPIDRIHAREDRENGTAPKWRRPDPIIHWSCDGCGVEVVTDPDDETLTYSPFRDGEPTLTPAHTFDHGAKVCEFCLDHCSECGTELSSHLEYGDTYDDGNPFPDPRDHNSHVCIDCLDIAESEAAAQTWKQCYTAEDRIEYIRDHRNDFDFDDFPDMLRCVRGEYFKGCASELIG